MMTRRMLFTFPLIAIAAFAAAPAYGADPAGNIQLEIPSQVQCRAGADGSLVTPSPDVMSFKNNSSFEVRIAGLRFDAAAGFNVVDDASESSLPNSVSIEIRTAGDKVNLADCAGAKKNVGDTGAWLMSPGGADEKASRLPIVAQGYAANIRDVGTVGSIEWYVVSDTVTNQVLGRLDSLEDASSRLQGEVDGKAGKDEAVTGIARDGDEFTATRADGSSFTFDQKDDDTWVPNSSVDAGYVAAGSGHAGKVWKTDGDGNPAWRDDSDSVTGVKGNSESSYRTGLVNITPDNIGAAPAGDVSALASNLNSMDLLWSAPSMTRLSDGQTITLSKSVANYKMVMFQFRHHASGCTSYVYVPYPYSNGWMLSSIYSATDIAMSYGGMSGTRVTVTGSTASNHVVLDKIYGLKYY